MDAPRWGLIEGGLGLAFLSFQRHAGAPCHAEPKERARNQGLNSKPLGSSQRHEIALDRAAKLG